MSKINSLGPFSIVCNHYRIEEEGTNWRWPGKEFQCGYLSFVHCLSYPDISLVRLRASFHTCSQMSPGAQSPPDMLHVLNLWINVIWWEIADLGSTLRSKHDFVGHLWTVVNNSMTTWVFCKSNLWVPASEQYLKCTLWHPTIDWKIQDSWEWGLSILPMNLKQTKVSELNTEFGDQIYLLIKSLPQAIHFYSRTYSTLANTDYVPGTPVNLTRPDHTKGKSCSRGTYISVWKAHTHALKLNM